MAARGEDEDGESRRPGSKALMPTASGEVESVVHRVESEVAAGLGEHEGEASGEENGERREVGGRASSVARGVESEVAGGPGYRRA